MRNGNHTGEKDAFRYALRSFFSRKHVLSERAEKVSAIYEEIIEAGDPDDEAEEISLIVAGYTAARNRRIIEERGGKITRWDKRNAPVDPYGPRETCRFVDHEYRIRTGKGEDAHNLYVSEPYQVGSADVKTLARLVDEGHSVTISAGLCKHFPGSVVRVDIESAEDADKRAARSRDTA